jgi:protein-S-isoprenylcysteine O-methyltransferase Ste14
MKKRLKVTGFVIFIIFSVIIIFPRLFFRTNKGNSYLDIILEISGIALILLGQIFRVSARGYKADYSQESQALIQNGPYAFVRNPMYLGIFLIGLGVVAVLFKWWVICIFLAVFILHYVLLIVKEEKKLLETFPKEYDSYKNQVPRIIPAMNMLFKIDIANILPLKFKWIKKEIGSILGVLLVTLVLKFWQDIQYRGINICLQKFVWIILLFGLFTFLVIYLNKKTQV